MRNRCRAVHDFKPRDGKGLRCSLEAGHRDICSPGRWERMSQAQYRRLTEDPPRKLREAK